MRAAARSPSPNVPKRAATNLAAFCDALEALDALREATPRPAADAADAAAALGPAEGSMAWFLLRVLEQTGYEQFLKHESTDGADRWRNVRELANLAAPSCGRAEVAATAAAIFRGDARRRRRGRDVDISAEPRCAADGRDAERRSAAKTLPRRVASPRSRCG